MSRFSPVLRKYIVGMTLTHTIKDLENLLRLTECDSPEALEESVLLRTEGDGFVEANPNATGIEIVVGFGTAGDVKEFKYPFTLEDFWASISELVDVQDTRRELTYLPEVIFEEDGSFDNSELMAALDSYFELDPGGFECAVGGGWFTDDACAPTGASESEPLWLFAGDPLMVAIAIGVYYVEVGVPTYFPANQGGPALIEVEIVETVDLEQEGAIDSIAVGLIKATKKSKKRCEICWQCRTLKEKSDQADALGRWTCRDCEQQRGAIIC